MLFKQLAVTAAYVFALGARASPYLTSDLKTINWIGKREAPSTYELHERQHAHWARQWTKTDRVPARTLLPMRIGLVQRGLEDGARHLRKM